MGNRSTRRRQRAMASAFMSPELVAAIKRINAFMNAFVDAIHAQVRATSRRSAND